MNHFAKHTYLFFILFITAGAGLLYINSQSTHMSSPDFTPTLTESQAKADIELAEASRDRKQKDIRILFLGDMMFDRSIRDVIGKKSVSHIFSDFDASLASTDLNVANLEGPVAERQSVSVGSTQDQPQHFTFVFDPKIVAALKERKFLVNLGNNHIMNFGADGFRETKDNLEREKVPYFGEPDENNSYIADLGGLQVGFAGYNRFVSADSKQTCANIVELKKKTDLVVVYTHWGQEYKKSPNESQIELAHAFIDAGANIVVGSHPHVIQPVEQYNGKYIFYSLGNFIFDQYFSKATMQGLGVILNYNSNSKQLSFALLPHSIDKSGKLHTVEGKEKDELLHQLAESSSVGLQVKEDIKRGVIN